MKTMKALVYDKSGREFSSIRQIPYPTCGDNDIIVKVMSASICKGVEHDHDRGVGTDLAKYPVVPGHEFSGYVFEVGKNVKNVKIGDRVTCDNTEYCGECYYCLKEESNYCPTFGSLGHNINGGFAEYVRVNKDKAFLIPESVSFNAAALCEPIACCLHAVDRSNIRYGDTVVVFGAGFMGMILAQLFNHSNAREVILIASTQSKLDIAEKLGIRTILMDRNDYSKHEKILLERHPLGVNVIVDATGSPKVCENSMKLLKKGGMLLQYAVVHSDEKMTLDPRLMFNNELPFTTSFCQSHNFGRAVEALESGIVNGEALVTGEYDLDDFYAALDENVNDRNSLKVIIHPNKE